MLVCFNRDCQASAHTHTHTQSHSHTVTRTHTVTNTHTHLRRRTPPAPAHAHCEGRKKREGHVQGESDCPARSGLWFVFGDTTGTTIRLFSRSTLLGPVQLRESSPRDDSPRCFASLLRLAASSRAAGPTSWRADLVNAPSFIADSCWGLVCARIGGSFGPFPVHGENQLRVERPDGRGDRACDGIGAQAARG